ncbi:glycine/sarcosine/betaine reductase selenoprotein B family protein [Thermodesulfobacteriota bacterium]
MQDSGINRLRRSGKFMVTYTRLKNRFIAKMATRFPSLAKQLIDSFTPWESQDIPWTPVVKPLNKSRVVMITTAGVHHKSQTPFDMFDPDGDPTYREIDSTKPLSDLMITHDYYDHTDADKDINIVFPLDRLKEFEKEGYLGSVANFHYSFMGHIDGDHIPTLIKISAPEIGKKLKTDGTDIVLLTPG